MVRPTVDETWLDVARVLAKRGTCSRLQVGAVLTRNGRVVATGWNGAPPGQPHCEHDGYEEHCGVSIHAERNVIGFAAREGIRTENATMYITHVPCAECATVLIAAGIGRVVFLDPYAATDGERMLEANGIQVDWAGSFES